jgi:energy-converting hydrogenase A subunit M
MLRIKTRWGKPYEYRPRGNLLRRISKTLNISLEEAYDMLLKEREYLLQDKVNK